MARSEVALKKLLNKILCDLKYNHPKIEIKPATLEGFINHTTKLFVVTVTNEGKETLNLFAKVGISNEEFRNDINATYAYANEDKIYTKIANAFEQIEDKHGVPKEERYVFAKYYGSSLELGQEVFVFEDLRSKGYNVYEITEPIDCDRLFVATSILAKWHSLGFALEKEFPELFNELTMDVTFVDKLVDSSRIAAQESIKLLDEEYQTRILKFLTEDVYVKFKKFFKPQGRKILVHGDYKVSNIMFKNEGEKIVALPVDYQGVRHGCGIMDLFFLITLGTDETVRTHFDRLMDHYHEQLTVNLRRLGINVNEVYPKEQFLSELKEILPATLVMALSLYPLILADSAVAQETIADENQGIGKMFLTPTTKSTERLMGYVRDCERWGII